MCSFAAAQDEHPPLDLHSIPISDWLNEGEHAEIPWKVTVRPAYLRVDQRLELTFTVRLGAKDLNRLGQDHELFLISRFSTPDGEWLNEPFTVRHTLEGQLPKSMQAEFFMRAFIQPGDYLLWTVLYDRKTGKHSVAKRRIHVSELRNDPLPELWAHMPPVQFPETASNTDADSLEYLAAPLNLPVHNKRPLQVEIISMLSPPEQWTGRQRIVRAHTDSTLGAVTALSQMDLSQGTFSITGLDLVRRKVIFEQQDVETVEWPEFMQAMKKAQALEVSAAALQGAKQNGAFFREILTERLENRSSDPATRVIIVVTSARLFESGSDLRPIQVEGDCNCRVYHLRFRLTLNDLFDQLERLMKPLHPRTFNLLTSADLRKAIAEIIEDLEKLPQL